MKFYLEYVQWDFGKKGIAVEWSARQQALECVCIENARVEAAKVKAELLQRLPPAIDEEGNIYPKDFVLVGREAV